VRRIVPKPTMPIQTCNWISGSTPSTATDTSSKAINFIDFIEGIMKLTGPFGTSISPPTRFGSVLCTPVVQPENPEASIEIAPRKTVPGAPHIFRVDKDMSYIPHIADVISR
jgi:hypothetical protein